MKKTEFVEGLVLNDFAERNGEMNELTVEITLHEYRELISKKTNMEDVVRRLRRENRELHLINDVLAEVVQEAFAEDAGIVEKLQAAVRKIAAARRRGDEE